MLYESAEYGTWYTQWMLVSLINISNIIINCFFIPLRTPLSTLPLRSFLNLSLALALAQKEFDWQAHSCIEVEFSWASKRSSILSSSEKSWGPQRGPLLPFSSFCAICPDICLHCFRPMSLFMSAWGSPCGEDIQLIALPKRWVNAERGWCWEFLSTAADFCRPREEYTGQEGVEESLGCYPL